MTSQIFANIYLNEFDRFVVHTLRPSRYLRYGDDFIMIGPNRLWLENCRQQAKTWLKNMLGLAVNSKNDILVPVRQGIHFLGVDIFSFGRRLRSKNWQRVMSTISQKNIASYRGFILQHHSTRVSYFDWSILEFLEKEDA